MGKLFIIWRNVIMVCVMTLGGQKVQARGIASELWTATPADFTSEISSHALSISDWIQKINAGDYNFICLGERHSEAYRSRLSHQLFSKLAIEQLFLEVSEDKGQDLLVEYQLKQDPEAVKLLGPAIGPLLKNTLRASPGVEIAGVDMTPSQAAEMNLEKAQNPNSRLSRDGFIAANILKRYKPGGTALALYGANHCAKYNVDTGWMRPFHSMLQQALPAKEKTLSVRVILGDQARTYPLNPEMTLLLYLEQTEYHGKSFVLPDLSKISRATFNGKASFQGLFDSYDALVVLWP